MEESGSFSQAREHVLQVAGALFSERGYAAVTIRDIAQALNMRQSSLYYHAPQGKEQLFLEVTERSLTRHGKGITQAITQAEPTIDAQLNAIASWLLSQPPVDLTRLFRSDLPALSSEHSQRLFKLASASLLEPIKQVITDAYQRGEVRFVNEQVMAVSFVSVIETIHDMHRYTNVPKAVLAGDVIEVILDGMRRH